MVDGTLHSIVVDHTKKYRFSVWMKRISTQANGTFYFGTNGGGAVVRDQDGVTDESNPYFECRGVNGFTKDVWYLHVGHVFPSGSTNVGRDAQTGVYTMSGFQFATNGCNLGGDAVMQSGTTSLRHRTYHYYANSSGTELVFAYPRMEEVTASTPNIINSYLSGAFTNTGDQGSKGLQPNGDIGDQGAVGTAGDKGSQPTGDRGAVGDGGAGGDKGIKGIQPKGVTGDGGGAGDKGIKGVQATGGQGDQGGGGDKGIKGVQPKGVTGDRGGEGDKGIKGVQPLGVKGATGTGGDKGNQGPAPTGAQGGGGDEGGEG